VWDALGWDADGSDKVGSLVVEIDWDLDLLHNRIIVLA